MRKIENKHWFYFFSLLFIALNIGFIAYDIYYLAFLPVILLFFFASFIALDKVLLTIVFFTPLSIQLKDFITGISINVSIPTEPILFGVFILFIFKILLDGKIDKRIITHPVSIAIYFYLFWMLITSLTSTMPVVSIKYLLSKIWFIVSMYILAAHLFKDKKNIGRFIWVYVIAMILVIVYTNYRLSGYGFDNQRASNWVAWPFFSDHTSYGAMLVLFLFPLYYFMMRKNTDLFMKTVTGLVFCIFILALVFSYTRAAWLSLFGGIVLWIIIKLKLRFRTVLFGVIMLFLIGFISYSSFERDLEKNKAESSGNFSEHIVSMANISTDASNLERLNRWKCAIRMFKEKPIFGWGPGTYMFKYAPFQFSYDKTIISTDFGDLGNAHSEYLGPLAESGVLGLLSVLILLLSVFYTGYKTYNSNKGETRVISLYISLGLATYFIHGFLNNFLDSDKGSVPVWGFIAILVALDVYHNEQKDTVKYEPFYK